MKKFALSASLYLLGLSCLAYLSFRGSLPKLNGMVLVNGLEAPVLIERDALGVATIRGETRIDVARPLNQAPGLEIVLFVVSPQMP